MEPVFKGTGESPSQFCDCMQIICYCDFHDDWFDDYYHNEIERVWDLENPI
jgi:hypothetical protein